MAVVWPLFSVALGKFNPSSQHVLIGDVDELEKVEVRSIAPGEALLAWEATRSASIRAKVVLKGDFRKALQRGRGQGRWRVVGRRPSATDASANAAVCLHRTLHRPRRSRQAAMFFSPSVNRSRLRALVQKAFERSPGNWSQRPRRSRASCGATQPRAAVALSTVLTRHSGMPTVPPAAPSLPNP